MIYKEWEQKNQNKLVLDYLNYLQSIFKDWKGIGISPISSIGSYEEWAKGSYKLYLKEIKIKA